MKVDAETLLLGIEAHSYVLEKHGDAFRSFMTEVMRVHEFSMVDTWQEGESMFLKTITRPDMGTWVPKPLASRIGPDFVYFDVLEFRSSLLLKPPFTVLASSSCPALGDRVELHSRVTIDQAGPEQARHRLEQDITFRLLGFGQFAERLAKKAVKDTFAQMPEIMQQWKRVRQELLQTPGGRLRLVQGQPDLRHLPWVQQYLAEMLPQPHVPRNRPSFSTAHQPAAAVLSMSSTGSAFLSPSSSLSEEADQLNVGSMPAGEEAVMPDVWGEGDGSELWGDPEASLEEDEPWEAGHDPEPAATAGAGAPEPAGPTGAQHQAAGRHPRRRHRRRPWPPGGGDTQGSHSWHALWTQLHVRPVHVQPLPATLVRLSLTAAAVAAHSTSGLVRHTSAEAPPSQVPEEPASPSSQARVSSQQPPAAGPPAMPSTPAGIAAAEEKNHAGRSSWGHKLGLLLPCCKPAPRTMHDA